MKKKKKLLFKHQFCIYIAIPSGFPIRNRPSSKMTKYVECWGADKPFANITDSKMAKNIGLAVINLKYMLNKSLEMVRSY